MGHPDFLQQKMFPLRKTQHLDSVNSMENNNAYDLGDAAGLGIGGLGAGLGGLSGSWPQQQHLNQQQLPQHQHHVHYGSGDDLVRTKTERRRKGTE